MRFTNWTVFWLGLIVIGVILRMLNIVETPFNFEKAILFSIFAVISILIAKEDR